MSWVLVKYGVGYRCRRDVPIEYSNKLADAWVFTTKSEAFAERKSPNEVVVLTENIVGETDLKP